jgi:hypothetical protein
MERWRQKYIQGFWCGELMERDNRKDLGLNGRI